MSRRGRLVSIFAARRASACERQHSAPGRYACSDGPTLHNRLDAEALVLGLSFARSLHPPVHAHVGTCLHDQSPTVTRGPGLAIATRTLSLRGH
eukprot:188932-Prymnesium_polylepis.2